jgi:leader peptidase (prepilin peptidase) / N-methyltransferase
LQHLIYILFFFALGACVGSFLNVVVWRLPRGESIVSPPSRCPYCEHRLAWYDNLPVIGWLKLGGRCRYCHNPISAQYPTVEFLTGLMFVLYYVAYFVLHEGPCWIETTALTPWQSVSTHYGLTTINEHWPQYLLVVLTLSCLLAASMIDARFFFIPMSLPIMLTIVGLVYHTILDRPRVPLSLTMQNAPAGAMAIGAGVGLIISNVLLWKKIFKPSFLEGWPALEIDKDPDAHLEPSALAMWIGRMVEWFRRPLTAEQRKVMEQARAASEAREKKLDEEARRQSAATQPPLKEMTRNEIRREMRHEMKFLMPPLVLGFVAALLVMTVGSVGGWWTELLKSHLLSGFVGSLWGALMGAFIIWLMRIMGTVILGREAMGLGDVHLMFGIGAVLGAAGATFTFFVAPFFALVYGVCKYITRNTHELPFGPYLSMGAAVVLVLYCRLLDYFGPPMSGLVSMVAEWLRGQ